LGEENGHICRGSSNKLTRGSFVPCCGGKNARHVPIESARKRKTVKRWRGMASS